MLHPRLNQQLNAAVLAVLVPDLCLLFVGSLIIQQKVCGHELHTFQLLLAVQVA